MLRTSPEIIIHLSFPSAFNSVIDYICVYIKHKSKTNATSFFHLPTSLVSCRNIVIFCTVLMDLWASWSCCFNCRDYIALNKIRW